MTENLILFVIDDDVDLAESLEMVFETKAYSVRLFEDVESGLETFKTGVIPQSIIIDGSLPGLTGPEGITAFREGGYGGIFIGMSGEDFEEKMISAGATKFWAKPFEMSEFIASVDHAMLSSGRSLTP